MPFPDAASRFVVSRYECGARITPGYSGQLPVVDVSVHDASNVGKCVASAGNVSGSFPPGSATPRSTSAVAGPPIWPGYHISRIDLTEPAHGISTGSPVFRTTIVFGCAAATAAI